VVESGQKIQIKTPGVNGKVSPLSTFDPIELKKISGPKLVTSPMWMHTYRWESTDLHTCTYALGSVQEWKVWQTHCLEKQVMRGKMQQPPGLVKLEGREREREWERTWFFSLTGWFLKPQFPPGWSQSTLARSKQPMHNSKILFPSKGSCFEILNFELLHMKKNIERE